MVRFSVEFLWNKVSVPDLNKGFFPLLGSLDKNSLRWSVEKQSLLCHFLLKRDSNLLDNVFPFSCSCKISMLFFFSFLGGLALLFTTYKRLPSFFDTVKITPFSFPFSFFDAAFSCSVLESAVLSPVGICFSRLWITGFIYVVMSKGSQKAHIHTHTQILTSFVLLRFVHVYMSLFL